MRLCSRVPGGIRNCVRNEETGSGLVFGRRTVANADCPCHPEMKIEFIDIIETIGDTKFKAADHRGVKLTLEFLDTHL